jgi:hypothetical protein
MKITMQEFEEFERQFIFEVLKNPDYRIGQAFYNTFPKIAVSMELQPQTIYGIQINVKKY